MNFKKILATIIAVTSMISTITCINASANEEVYVDNNEQVEFVESYPEELEVYAQELDNINEEFGTNYTFDFSDCTD